MQLPRVAVLGGCGHVGLPLAPTFASKGGCDVTVVDVNAAAVAEVDALPQLVSGVTPRAAERAAGGLLQ